MSLMLDQFQKLLGKNTKQQGHYWCIPASLSNALRTLGCEDYTQERIRDLWYAHSKRVIEPDVNLQFKEGAGFHIINCLASLPDFSTTFCYDKHEDAGDKNPFELTKAEKALAFVENHVREGHLVIVSTWEIRVNRTTGKLKPACCHMWLVLDFDPHGVATYHDPATDTIEQIPVRNVGVLTIGTASAQLDVGLRGRITHSDYNCLALWKK